MTFYRVCAILKQKRNKITCIAVYIVNTFESEDLQMKKISLLVAICMFLTVMVPHVMADSSEEMTAAIALVKERVEIPENCTEFWGNKSLFNKNESKWEFRWETPEGAASAGYVSVTMRENGIIESVYSHTSGEEQAYKAGKTLPKISEAEALQIAVHYSAKINPSICAEYAEGAKAAWWGDRYSVTIPRTVGGVPVYNNSATVQISSQTGNVVNYNLTHNDKAVFQPSANPMSAEEAQNAYMHLGYLKKEYRIFEDKVLLVYTPGNAENLIDATTGAPYIPKHEESFRGTANDMVMKEEAAAAGKAELTPQERKAVEEAAGLITYAEATEIIKGVPQFYMPDDMILEVGNTYKTAKGQYIIRISLQSSATDSYARVYGELDGETGEILYFNASDKMHTEQKVDAEAATATFAAFAETYLTAYAKHLVAKEAELTENAAFIKAERTENSIPVYGNGVSVTVEPGGKITHFALNWDRDAVFPSAENSISSAAAYAILYANAIPEFYYYATGEAADPIYAMGAHDFAFIAAEDGALLSYSGKPYVKQNIKGYTDIAGHYAEEAILALDSVGAHLGGTAFMPDAVMTQAEFVTLVSNCVMGYYPLTDGSGADVAKIYTYAVRNGILPKDEEAPDTPLTRETAVAYLLRAMGYGDFAEIEGIFKCDFADADTINPAFYGYVAIAKGLGIINGDGSGIFAPAREMTRGEGAVMIYNYLK